MSCVLIGCVVLLFACLCEFVCLSLVIRCWLVWVCGCTVMLIIVLVVNYNSRFVYLGFAVCYTSCCLFARLFCLCLVCC